VSEPYNPLAMTNLAESIATALLASDPSPLADLPNKGFPGAGIYALYYVGAFPAYELVAKANRDGRWAQPIYTGKAIPQGGRKGKTPVDGVTTSALWGRLREHRASVSAATNLEVDDFWCRWLVIEPIWIPLGENLLINRYKPVWNAIVDGFGNHDPGAGRRVGKTTLWDVLHPGRAFAGKQGPREQRAEHITADIMEYLRARIDP
jgi:hypothetical protein